MSNPANPQNPSAPQPQGAPTGYPQQAQGAPGGYPQQAQGAPGGYPQQPQQSQRPSATADRGIVRQILFGGAVVLGIAIATSILSTIGNSVFGFRGEQILGLLWSIFIALVFVAGAGLSALYISPFAKATSTKDLIKRLAIAAGIGAAALLVVNFIWSVINGGQYLVQMIVSSGLFGSISTAIAYGAFFALGVFVARALPAAPAYQPSAGAGQDYQAPQQHGYQQQQQGYQQPQQPGYAQPLAPGAGQGQTPVQPQQPLPPQA